MLDFELQFPRISRAVRLIAADNGDHHAERLGHATAGTLIERRIRAGSEGVNVDELEEIETFLAGLSDERLETLCIGEHADVRAIGAPQLVEDFLERAFEGGSDD